jgi:N-acylglucosamine 2-epimerase
MPSIHAFRVSFLDKHGYATDGKLFYTVTREGRPLRMRRYVYSEAFASIAHAAYQFWNTGRI